MKLILTHEVTGLGEPGDIIEVKDGYGRNYLIPRGYAIRWSRGGEKDVAAIRRARKVREIRTLDQATEVKGRLAGLKVTLQTRAGDTGRLFGSVTVADVVAAIKAAGGPDIDKRRVEIGTPIKTVGSHRITVRLHQEVSAALDLDVVPA
ncbi:MULTISPECIES: 50S ribosomal protein L9 [Embleya]|uniref:Large ribosomal subunit protein bL9 n=2 Tax=Embleya TaxID=2699295 RepID=A0A1T3NZ67_9ACTN|nr:MULTISPECIES: 50S ribosomal protein L9 [Embleya]OPC82012.1 50S ribosomal protein L9 [Embleya scabrispora]GCD98383.1 50S ribosomal protein L9 [Embleya hyalina]